jgi:hypothetical protein
MLGKGIMGVSEIPLDLEEVLVLMDKLLGGSRLSYRGGTLFSSS